MEMTLSTWTVAAAAALIAGISKGGFGGGVGFVSTLTLALAIAPAAAAAIMLPVLIAIDQVGMATWWRTWSLKVVGPALIAAAVGVCLGGLLFHAVSVEAFRLTLGFIALAFLAFQRARARGWTPTRKASSGRASGGSSRFGRHLGAAIWGGAAGVTSTISHAGGPPVAIYLLGQNLTKTAYQGSSVLIFWAINLMKLGPYAALGVLDGGTLAISLPLIPAAFIGVAIGVWAHKRVPEAIYLRVMTALLFCTAVKLIWDGATGL